MKYSGTKLGTTARMGKEQPSRVPMGVELPKANMDYTRSKGDVNDTTAPGPRVA